MKRKVLLITALALTASILTGCTSGTNSESSSAAESPVAESSVAENSAQTTSEASGSETSAAESASEAETPSQGSVPEETQQASAEGSGQEETTAAQLKYSVQPIGTEGAWYRVLSARSDGTYLAMFTDDDDNYTRKAAVLDKDLTLIETLSGELIYSLTDVPACVVLDKTAHKYVLWINGSTYDYDVKEVDNGRVFYVNSDIVTYGEDYFSIDGEKLDYTYRGAFTDGHCFYTEDGKTMCLNADGTVADYTEQVKFITDAGKQVTALIDDTYFVAKADSDSIPTWYDKDGNEVIAGYPIEVNGKYIFDGYACIYEDQQVFYVGLAEPHNKTTDATQEMVVVREWGSDSILLEGGKLFHSDGTYTDTDNMRYSNFYNGAALAICGDSAFFINTKFERISEVYKSEGGESLYAEYIGNGQYCLTVQDGYYLLSPEF